MTRRIAAIVFIFLCTAFAWAVLGTTIFHRTYSSDSALRGRVASAWGAPQEQSPPTATYEQVASKTVETVEEGKKIVRTLQEKVQAPLPLDSSRVEVAFDLEHRQKGLL